MPASRSHGMDQDFYQWSPIVARPVLRWPNNARVALAVIVNLEHWDWAVPEGTAVAGRRARWVVPRACGPVTSRNSPISAAGASTNSNRVGVFHILALLDPYGITPT